MDPVIRSRLTVFLLVLLIVVFLLPVFSRPGDLFSSVDWYEKYCFLASARTTLLTYHQMPLRSPYIFGGYPTIGHPYDDSLNPLFIFTLLFGEGWGVRLTVFALIMLGGLGMFYLARKVLGFGLFGAFFSAALFSLSSHAPCQFTEGNLEKLYLYLIPWLAAFFIQSRRDIRYIFPAGLVLGVILVKGVVIFSALVFLALLALLYSFEEGGRWRPFYILAGAGVAFFSFCLFAPKLFPAIDLLRLKQGFVHFPFEDSYRGIAAQIVNSGRALSWQRLYEALMVKSAYIVDGDDFSQMYVGLIPVTLFLFAAARYWKRFWRFILMAGAFLLLAAGPNSPVDLFGAFWRLHPYVHFVWKLDESFYTYILFFLTLVAGGAFSVLDKPGRPRILLLAAFIITAICIFDIFGASQRFLKHPDPGLREAQFGQKMPLLRMQERFFQVQFNFPEKTKEDYFYILENVGMTNFKQDVLINIPSYAVPRYFVDPGDYLRLDRPAALKANPAYAGEAFFRDRYNQADLVYFSPNRIRVRVIVSRPGMLVINQNYHPAWRCTLGKTRRSAGLLSVALSRPGDYEVAFHYVPLDFYCGLMLSIAAMAAAVIICRKKRHGPARKRGVRHA